MGPSALIARVLVVGAAVAPWLGWTGLARSELGRACCATALLVAAAHGLGLAVARASRRKPGAVLAMLWGLAALVVLEGVAMLARAPVQVYLLYGGVAIHSIVLVARTGAIGDQLAEQLAWPRSRFWLLPVGLVLALGILHLLGTIGSPQARVFDDDGNLLAQAKRLVDTGTLGDAVGYARSAQLGGNAALGSFAAAAGGSFLVRAIDPLGEILLLLLVGMRMRPRDAHAVVLWSLSALLASSLVLRFDDPLPVWMGAAMIVGLEATAADDAGSLRDVIPSVIMAGALLVLRDEFAPVAIVLAFSTAPRTRARLLATAAGLGAAVAPYMIVLALARGAVHGAGALLVPRHASLALRLPLAIASTALALAVVFPVLAPLERRRWWVGFALAAGIGGIVSRLTGNRLYANHLLVPIAIAAAALVLIELGRTAARALSGATLVIVALACVLLVQDRLEGGRNSWSRRYFDDLEGIEYLRVMRGPDARDAMYRALLEHVPPGAVVAIRVSRADELDYARHRLVDLATPRGQSLQVPPWRSRHTLARLLERVGARYAMIEDEGAGIREAELHGFVRWLCADARCADDVSRLVVEHRVIAGTAQLALVDLWSSTP